MAKKKLPKKSTKKATKPPKRPARPAARKAKARAKAPAKAKAVRKPLKTTKIVKPAARKLVRKSARKVVKPAAKTTARKVVKKAVKAVKKVVRKVARKSVRKVAAKPVRKAAARTPVAARKVASQKVATPPPPVRLQRERRRLPEVEAEGFTGTGGDSRLLQSAKAGHDEMRSELRQHTESSPELTAGDVDAKWQDAYAVGDEAPGGDNMTPDQDRVDDIGKALGIEYDDDEELQGGAEITARDESRWELDPESKEADEDE